MEQSFLILLCTVVITGFITSGFYIYYQRRRRASAYLRQLSSFLSDMVFYIDKHGKLLDVVNPQRDIMCDYPTNAHIGRYLEELCQDSSFVGNSGIRVWEAVKACIQTHQPGKVSYEISNNNQIFKVEGMVTPFHGEVIAVFRNVTPIYKAQQEVNEVNKKLKLALQAGSISVWSYLPEEDAFDLADIETVPQPGMRLANVTNQLVVEDRARHRKLVSDIVDGVCEKCVETFRLVTPEGNIRWYEIYASGVRDDYGKVVRLIGTQKDITSQKDKIQELKENKEQRDLLLQITNMIIWEYDCTTNQLISPHENLFYDKISLLTDNIQSVIGEHQEIYKTSFADLQSGKISLMNIKIQIKALDGSNHWIRLIGKPSKVDSNGKVLRLIGTREDITEQVEKEEKLLNYIRRTDLAIQSGDIIQWDFDKQTNTFTRLYTDFENPGTFIRKPFLFTLHPDDRHVLNDMLSRLLNDNYLLPNIHFRIKVEGEEKEDEYQWVNSFAVPLERDEKGEIQSITGLLIDITHIEKVEEANRMKSAFLANMSHEIRTPLNAIVGFSQLLMEEEDKDEMKEFVRLIEYNNNLLLQIINDILFLSQIEAGKMKFIYSDFDVVEAMTDLQRVHTPLLNNGVILNCILPCSSYIIHSERNRLTQVLSNLLSNASKFTTEGCITMGFEPTATGLSFYVTDTGKGIAKENLSQIFERFTKFDHFVSGTGLGLPICQMIVHKLGGGISIESELGRGSTFSFTIVCDQVIADTKENSMSLVLS